MYEEEARRSELRVRARKERELKSADVRKHQEEIEQQRAKEAWKKRLADEVDRIFEVR